VLWDQVILPFLLNKYKIDIFHYFDYTPPIYIPCKFVLHSLDISYEVHPEWFPLKTIYRRLLTRKAVHRADKLIAISEFTKKELIRVYKLNPTKIIVAHIASSLELAVKEAVSDPNNAIQESPQAEEIAKWGSKQMLFVGSLHSRRHPELLLEVLKYCQEKDKEITLNIVGANLSYPRTDYRWLTEHSGVKYNGYIDDKTLRKLYLNSAVLLYTSEYEGFGLPLVEAMKFGVPIVALPTEINREVLGNDNLHTVKTACFNGVKATLETHRFALPQALAERAYKLITDKSIWEKESAACLERSKLFSWEQSAAKALNVYKEL